MMAAKQPVSNRWLRKSIPAVIVIWCVSIATFLLANLMPGDPVAALLGENATPETVALWRERFGLDEPIFIRYFDWLGNVLTGDLGYSFHTNESVLTMLSQRIPVTLEILVVTQIIALMLAIPSAIYTAWHRNRWLDRVFMGGSLGLLSIPPFLIGVVLIYIFAIKLGWFPATGYVPFGENPIENLRSILLPALALALAEFPVYMRLLRSDLIQTLQQDFIVVARAKGLSPRRILWRHALKPSSFSLLTVVGINIGRLIGGTVIIEVLFSLPGVGQMLIQSIFQQDFMVLQGVVLLIATGFVLVNLLIDALYAWLDPRAQ